MPESNVEKLLMAILTNDPSYVVKPESRIEALLLAIYENGGSGGGGGAFKSGTVKTCVLNNTPVYGYKVGDKYIDFILNNDDGEEQHVYVLVSDLVDDKAIGISYDNSISKLEAENIQAAIDELVASKLEVDDELSDISENPVQNKVVKKAIDSLITLPDTTAKVGQMVKVKRVGSDNKPDEFEYGNIPEMTAENVSYDNSKSELEAENVQDAIDEFYEEITHVNESLASKANAGAVYTKAETYSKSETYSKTEVYTKTQTNKAITDEVAKIVAEAPEDFDTLKEMSDWISDHEESASAMNTAIQSKITAPQTATVGQILAVKAVSADGKPTEWECVDQSSGGEEEIDPVFGGHKISVKQRTYLPKVFTYPGKLCVAGGHIVVNGDGKIQKPYNNQWDTIITSGDANMSGTYRGSITRNDKWYVINEKNNALFEYDLNTKETRRISAATLPAPVAYTDCDIWNDYFVYQSNKSTTKATFTFVNITSGAYFNVEIDTTIGTSTTLNMQWSIINLNNNLCIIGHNMNASFRGPEEFCLYDESSRTFVKKFKFNNKPASGVVPFYIDDKYAYCIALELKYSYDSAVMVYDLNSGVLIDIPYIRVYPVIGNGCADELNLSNSTTLRNALVLDDELYLWVHSNAVTYHSYIYSTNYSKLLNHAKQFVEY